MSAYYPLLTALSLSTMTPLEISPQPAPTPTVGCQLFQVFSCLSSSGISGHQKSTDQHVVRAESFYYWNTLNFEITPELVSIPVRSLLLGSETSNWSYCSTKCYDCSMGLKIKQLYHVSRDWTRRKTWSAADRQLV